MKKLINCIIKNKVEFVFLLLVLFIGAFSRLYRVSEYMTFLGDEGRDALVLKAMILEHKFRLIGPVTSIGNMYLGPLYYYLILPAMIVSRLSPVGPSVWVAILGIATIFLIWLCGKEWFSSKVGLMAALLYAISPTAIIYSRSSWNPNVMPFFALLSIYGIWRVWRKNNYFWLPIIGVTLSFAFQSHYLGLLLFPTVGLFWLLTLLGLKKNNKSLRPFIIHSSLFVILFFLLSVAPLVWFDLRHNFINLNAYKAFFGDRQATVNFKIYKGIPQVWLLLKQLLTRLMLGRNEVVGKIVAPIISVPALALIIFRDKIRKAGAKINEQPAMLLVSVWLFIGLLGLANYKQHIYDHYFGFIYPAPFLLVSWCLVFCWENSTKKYARKAIQVLSIVFYLGLVTLSLRDFPLKYPPNKQLERTDKIAKFIIEKSNDRPFNLALIAKNNYDDAYTYLLEINGHPSVRINAQDTKNTITDQLFVICEELPCQPINHPKAEIAMFGWVKIEQKWETNGTEVYKLIHNYPADDKQKNTTGNK